MKKRVQINVPDEFARVSMAISKINGMKRERYLEELTQKLKTDFRENLNIEEKIKLNEKKRFFPKL